MKFAALLISAVAAAEVADKGDCSVADATCIAASCCGSVTVADGVTGPSTKVCFTKPTAAQLEAEAKGITYEITAASDDGSTPAVTGTFLCAAASDADAAGASYMTVGAAAVIAAAALLQ